MIAHGDRRAQGDDISDAHADIGGRSNDEHSFHASPPTQRVDLLG
jgi:hypothetical protein